MQYLPDFAVMKMIMRILIAFSFAGSLFILVDPAAYKKLNGILMKKYGMKKKLVPLLETEKDSLEVIILKNRKFFGALFLIFSFALLTLY